MRSPRSLSLRSHLLLGILLPVLVFVVINTFVLYRQALAAADTAYDRTLLATAKNFTGESSVCSVSSRCAIFTRSSRGSFTSPFEMMLSPSSNWMTSASSQPCTTQPLSASAIT